jgi:hypothetical protein
MQAFPRPAAVTQGDAGAGSGQPQPDGRVVTISMTPSMANCTPIQIGRKPASRRARHP